MKIFGIGILVVTAVLGLAWAIQGNDFFMYQMFAPRYESVRRQVFENTRSYNQGMIQELENMQFQYEQADASHKQALASIILHRAAGYNLDDPDVPNDLRVFITQLQYQQARAR